MNSKNDLFSNFKMMMGMITLIWVVIAMILAYNIYRIPGPITDAAALLSLVAAVGASFGGLGTYLCKTWGIVVYVVAVLIPVIRSLYFWINGESTNVSFTYLLLLLIYGISVWVNWNAFSKKLDGDTKA